MLYKLPSNGLRLGNFSAAAAAEPLSEVKHKTPGGPDSKSTSPTLSHARTVLSPYHSLSLLLPPSLVING